MTKWQDDADEAAAVARKDLLRGYMALKARQNMISRGDRLLMQTMAGQIYMGTLLERLIGLLGGEAPEGDGGTPAESPPDPPSEGG